MGFYMYLMALFNSKFLKLNMTFWLHAIWIGVNIIGRHNFGSMWRNLLDHVMFVLEKKCSTLPLWTNVTTPIFTLLWFSILINFINNLSFFNSCDSILVVVDCSTTMVHFILCTKIITSIKHPSYFSIMFYGIMASLKLSFLIVNLSLHQSLKEALLTF